MGMYIKSEGKGLDDLKKRLEFLKHHKLMIGIPEKKSARKGKKSARKGGDITNVALAFIHTNGSPRRGIPPRPFLEPGLVKTGALDRISTLMGEAARAAVNGQQSEAHALMESAAQEGADSVQEYILAGVSPGLAESTRAAKARKKSTKDVPLVDTSSMLKSIVGVVEED